MLKLSAVKKRIFLLNIEYNKSDGIRGDRSNNYEWYV